MAKPTHIIRHLPSAVASLAALLLAGCCLISGGTATSTDEFLGPDDFDGSYTKLPTPSFMGGQSNFDGDVVFTNLPRATVASILPDDLELAANTVGSTDHPTLIITGIQHNLQWIMPGGWALKMEKDYNELMLLIPFVQAKDGKKLWHNYVVRMYLDWPWAINAGNVLFGLQKEEAAFATTVIDPPPPDYTRVVEKNSIPLWRAAVSGLSAWMNSADAEAALPNYEAMVEILAMPLIGRLSMLQNEPYVCSYFRWNLDTAQVRQTEVEHRYLQNFVPDMGAWVSAGPLANVQQGAFGVDALQWRMSATLPCRF